MVTANPLQQQKMKNTRLSENFPNPKVAEAYLKPAADPSTEAFSWSLPDLDALRTLACGKFGWSEMKVDTHLLPIMKRASEKKDSQAKIVHFYPPTQPPVPNSKLKSKRLNTAVMKMIGKPPKEEPKGRHKTGNNKTKQKA